MNITFATGNQHKADKTSELLGIPLSHQKIDLDEIQTLDIVELATHKVIQAYEKIKSPVIVDDYGLYFNALSGLPGPFVKFFIEADDGLEKMCRMIDPFNNRQAYTMCVMAFYDGEVLKVFEKKMPGSISVHPMGTNGIHTDEIFIPEGLDKTRAQLDDTEYNEIYVKVRPLEELKSFLENSYGEKGLNG